MKHKSPPILNKVRGYRIIFPIVIGLGYVAYMFVNEFDINAFDGVEFGMNTLIWALVAFLLMFMRDFGYIIRLRILTNKTLSWRQSFNVIMLWEFTSAVTPSAIGGTSIALFYLNKEGLTIGKSSAVVMATSFLDELYFIIMFPLLFFTIKASKLFTTSEFEEFTWDNKYFIFVVIGYGIKLIYTFFLTYGLFRNPRGLKWLLLRIFRLSFLRKWKYGAYKAGSDIVHSSKELKSKPFKFWVKAFLATLLSWSSRYWVANCLMLMFCLKFDHFLVFARQFVMWIMMLIMPTPGGSGFSEYIFKDYLGEFISPVGLAVTIALLWRMVSYYPYLVAGIIILPRWIRNKYWKIHMNSK